jgi:alpha-tubulin suppressor-like RCC1 family protein
VYTMGANSKGNLGIGDKSTESSPIPCLVESLIGQKACKVACGYFHTVIATDIGEVYSWGDCENGATAHNSKEPLYSPMQISYFKDEQLFIKHISCGSRHTAFLSCKSII